MTCTVKSGPQYGVRQKATWFDTRTIFFATMMSVSVAIPASSPAGHCEERRRAR
jgi:hypothetical protein